MMNELYEKLTRLQWLLQRQQLRGWAERGPMADTTRGQGRILAILKMRDGVSTKELSYLLGVRVSSLNELLSKLEKGGYVTREQSGEDKRVMLVWLTEKGRAEREPESPNFGDIFACLTEDEQEKFSGYLDRVLTALQEKIGIDDETLERMAETRERMAGFMKARMADRDFRGGFGRFGHMRGPGESENPDGRENR